MSGVRFVENLKNPRLASNTQSRTLLRKTRIRDEPDLESRGCRLPGSRSESCADGVASGASGKSPLYDVGDLTVGADACVLRDGMGVLFSWNGVWGAALACPALAPDL